MIAQQKNSLDSNIKKILDDFITENSGKYIGLRIVISKPEPTIGEKIVAKKSLIIKVGNTKTELFSAEHPLKNKGFYIEKGIFSERDKFCLGNLYREDFKEIESQVYEHLITSNPENKQRAILGKIAKIEKSIDNTDFNHKPKKILVTANQDENCINLRYTYMGKMINKEIRISYPLEIDDAVEAVKNKLKSNQVEFLISSTESIQKDIGFIRDKDFVGSSMGSFKNGCSIYMGIK